MIITDDQRFDSMAVMPKTRSWFGDGGRRYTRAYVTTPLCCPARSSILSGKYAHNHLVTDNTSEARLRLNVDEIIQKALHDAGYRTAMAGKFLNSWVTTDPPPWFDTFALEQKYDYRDPIMNVDGNVGSVPGFATTIVREQAVSMLESFEANDAQPWFLYVAPISPHRPYGTTTHYFNAPVPGWRGNPAVGETDRSDKPAIVRSQSSTVVEDRALRKQQLRSQMPVDDLVERLAATLETLGEQDTIAIFTSDNGYMWGEHGVLEAKRLPYQPSVRVPLYVRWPGHVVPGTTDGRLVANVDLVPTILHATGLPADTLPTDGLSLLGLAKRDHLLLEYWRDAAAPGYGNWSALLTRRWEYVEWYKSDLATVEFKEYYDLAADPWQLENVLADRIVGNEPDVKQLSSWLSDDRTCAGADCLTRLAAS
jgi:arylsulfatase A-like enzyme